SNNIKITKFTSNDTWTKDPSAQIVQVIGWYGGGGGGSGRQGATTAAGGGGGGASGGMFNVFIYADALGSTETVTIGGGGTGCSGVATNDTDGNSGSAGGVASLGNSTSIVSTSGGAGGTATSALGGDMGLYCAGSLSPIFISNSINLNIDGGAGGNTNGT